MNRPTVTHAANSVDPSKTLCGLSTETAFVETDYHEHAVPNSRKDREWENEYEVTCKNCKRAL